MAAFFFYGSLRDRDLLEIVLGHDGAGLTIGPARAPGYLAVTMEGVAYPVLAEIPGAAAVGVLVEGLTAADMDRLAFFEEVEYGAAALLVEAEGREVEALAFRGTGKRRAAGEPWDYARWAREDRRVARHAARELMGFFGSLDIERVDDVWPGIMNRARARARAEEEPMPGGGPRGALGRNDVEVVERERPWAGYFSIEEYRLRHRTFAGGWSREIGRVAMHSGDAVTILPYDPRRDEVLLIEQFRTAPFARGDLRPWCIEPVAGRIDGSGTPEEIARREAGEEAGLAIGRIERIAEFYSTPGISAEVIAAFCGEADLAGAGGIHGLAAEGEDIRAFVLSFEDAMAAVAAGQVNTAPAILSLLWLGRERGRLRQAWA